MREAADKPAKTRGSLIIGFLTQEMQRRAIRGGLVVDAQLFEVRPFERSLQPTQCFKCQQWGHTQGACRRRDRCAQCAGDHASKDCPKERISCANCGKQHRAWQCRECPSYQAYFQGIQNRRIALYSQAESMRVVSLPQAPQTFPFQNEGWAVVSRKRTRAPSPNLEDTQRRLGRPTHLEQAARDPTQQRLEFSQGNVSNSQASSAESASFVEVRMTQDES